MHVMLKEMHMQKWLVQSSQKTFLSLIPLIHSKTGSSLFQSSGEICFLKCLELLDTLRAFRRGIPVCLCCDSLMSSSASATCCFERQVAGLNRPLLRQSLGSNLKLHDAQNFFKLRWLLGFLKEDNSTYTWKSC